MKRIKKIIASALLTVFVGLQSVPVYADGSVGDPNIENGGGGLQSGTSSNFWYQTDDGVRVTIVDSKTGEEKSASIDYTNKPPNDIQYHFGKNSKRDYTNGAALSLNTGTYTYKDPAQALPIIVSDGEYYVSNIDEIRSYFTDEQVVKAIASDMGFKFDDLINGDYKLMIEPIVYITPQRSHNGCGDDSVNIYSSFRYCRKKRGCKYDRGSDETGFRRKARQNRKAARANLYESRGIYYFKDVQRKGGISEKMALRYKIRETL